MNEFENKSVKMKKMYHDGQAQKRTLFNPEVEETVKPEPEEDDTDTNSIDSSTYITIVYE